MYFIGQKMRNLSKHRRFTALSEKKVPKSAGTVKFLFFSPSIPPRIFRYVRNVRCKRIELQHERFPQTRSIGGKNGSERVRCR